MRIFAAGTRASSEGKNRRKRSAVSIDISYVFLNGFGLWCAAEGVFWEINS